jgi:iron complex outermembrane receptor protein
MSRNIAILDLGKGEVSPSGALRCALPPRRGAAPQRPAGGPWAPRTPRLLLLCAAFFVSGAGLVGAQEAVDETIAAAEDSGVQSAEPAGDDGNSLDFVITAGRTPEETSKVAAQITVITAEDIAASGATSITRVLEHVAGVRFSGGLSGPGSETISMRGFGSNSFGRVLVLIDGNKINNPDMAAYNWNLISLDNIERIEVLDGSASVLYGNYAVGGVINIITKNSGKTAQTNINANAGSFYQFGINASHYQSLSWGSFFASGAYNRTSGYRSHSGAQTINAALGADINLNNTMSIGVNGSFARLDYQFPGWLTKAQFDKDPTRAQQGYWGYDMYWSPVWTPMPSNWLKDNGGTEYDVSSSIGFSWIPNETIEIDAPVSYMWKELSNNDVTNPDYPSYYQSTVNTLEFRPKAVANFNFRTMDLRAVGGVDLQFAHTNKKLFNDVEYNETKLSSNVAQLIIGPYLDLRFSPLDLLTFNAGARADSLFLTANKTRALSYSSGTPTVAAKPAYGKNESHTFVYDIGVSVRPVDIVKVYWKYSTLFRYPFTDEISSWYGTTYDYFNNELRPEKGFNTEGGIGLYLGKWGELQANIFYMRLIDEIAYDSGYLKPDGNLGANVNLDSTHRTGSNINLAVKILEYAELKSSYSFVSATFFKGKNKTRQIPQVPNHTIYESILIKLPHNISVGPDIEWRSSQFPSSDFDNQNRVEGFFLLGATARYVLDRKTQQYALQFTMRNMLDKHYATSVVYNASYPEKLYYYPEDGRSFNISLQVQF